MITISDNYTKAEVYDIAKGEVVNGLKLDKDEHKLPFTDAWIVNASSENVTYTIMTNKALTAFENHKQKWVVSSQYSPDRFP